jgi:hypothetical protein
MCFRNRQSLAPLVATFLLPLVFAACGGIKDVPKRLDAAPLPPVEQLDAAPTSGCVSEGLPLADGTACDDANACTLFDTCQGGRCIGADSVMCRPIDPCHTGGTCDPLTGACSNPAVRDGTTCDDANVCTQTDTCQGGVCIGANLIICRPIDSCHQAGQCNPNDGLCSNPRSDDGTPCGDAGTCSAGVCGEAP